MLTTDYGQRTTEEATPTTVNRQQTTVNRRRGELREERGPRLLESWNYCNLIDFSNYVFNSFRIFHIGRLVPPLRSMYLDSFRTVII